MRNYIILNGKNSNEINGLLIQELPPISKPQIRTETEEIDGRDGDIVTKLGFAAYDKEISVGLYKDFDINEIIAYFNSEGTIVFSNEPDKYYNYQIIDQIDFERLVRYRTATIRMHCQPFKYSTTQGTITKDASATVSDEGSNLVLENTAEAPFKRLEPKGNATQKTLSGKNKVNIPQDTEITYAQSPIDYEVDLTGKYTISGYVYAPNNSAAGSAGCIGLYVDGVWQYIIIPQGALTTKTFVQKTANGHITKVKLTNYGSSQNSSKNVYTNVMLESGSTATDYEPYCGGSPMPNPQFPSDVNVVSGAQTVKITGKNIFDKDSVSPINAYIASNGSIGYSAPDRLVVVPVNPNTTYTITAQRVGQIPEQYADDFSGAVFTSDTPPTVGSVGRRVFWGAEATNPTLNQTFTTSATENWLAIKVANVQRSDYAGSLATIQLEINDQATPFEPYQAQIQEINLGKNLFDISKVLNNGNNTLINNGDGTLTVKGLAVQGGSPNTLADYCPTLKEGDVATFNATSTSTVGYIYLYGANTTWNYGASKTITSAMLESHVAWYGTSGGEDTISNIQLELGTQATSYSPYKTPLELAKIGSYQDYIWNDDGTWKIHRALGKVVLTGDASESWAYVSGAHARFQYSDSSIALEPSPSAVGAVMSDHFTASSTNDIYSGIDGKIGVHATIHQFWFSYLAITDLNSFKTWLSTHNTTVYYALATPTDEEITDSELIEQLEALAEAHSYKGRTHINATATGNNAPHIIAAEVGVDNESTVTNSGNINSKPIIKIYGSGNIGAYLNDIQILQIALGDEGYITIDTNLMEAYKDTLDNLKNRLVTGDYSKFSLKPGANKIHFSGTVTKYEISKYSRWL